MTQLTVMFGLKRQRNLRETTTVELVQHLSFEIIQSNDAQTGNEVFTDDDRTDKLSHVQRQRATATHTANKNMVTSL